MKKITSIIIFKKLYMILFFKKNFKSAIETREKRETERERNNHHILFFLLATVQRDTQCIISKFWSAYTKILFHPLATREFLNQYKSRCLCLSVFWSMVIQWLTHMALPTLITKKWKCKSKLTRSGQQRQEKREP